jgi:hypothetical protein
MDASLDEKWLAQRLDQHQLEQVVAKLGDTYDPRIARAELALRGRAPLPDLVLAARTTSSPRYVAEAARHLERLGARELAERLLADARARGIEPAAADRVWLDPAADDAAVLSLARADHAARALRRAA